MSLIPLTLSAQDLAWVKRRQVVLEEIARIVRSPLAVMVQKAELAGMQLQERATRAKVGSNK